MSELSRDIFGTLLACRTGVIYLFIFAFIRLAEASARRTRRASTQRFFGSSRHAILHTKDGRMNAWRAPFPPRHAWPTLRARLVLSSPCLKNAKTITPLFCRLELYTQNVTATTCKLCNLVLDRTTDGLHATVRLDHDDRPPYIRFTCRIQSFLVDLFLSLNFIFWMAKSVIFVR